jgi:hypothetical protein
MTSDEIVCEQLFRETRDALSPSVDDLERVRQRLRVAISAGVAAGVVTAGKTSIAAAVAAKTGATAGLGVAAAITATLAVAGAGAYWMATRDTEPNAAVLQPVNPPLASASASTVSRAPLQPPDRADAESKPQASAPKSSPRQAVEPQVVSSNVKTQATTVESIEAPTSITADAPPTSSDQSVAIPPSSTLAVELEIVRSAAEALRSGHPADALAIARTGNVVQLAAELIAIEVDALCALNQQDDARELAKTFTTRFPHSALADRVKHSCILRGHP